MSSRKWRTLWTWSIILQGLFLLATLTNLPVRGQLPEKHLIFPRGKPSSPPLFSPGVLVGNTLYVSGKGSYIQSPSGNAWPPNIRGEVTQCLENVREVLLAAGMDYENVVSAYVFLEDLNHYEVMNEVFREKFFENPPVRSTLQAGKIPGRSQIEIQVIAVQDSAPKKFYSPPANWVNTDWWPFSVALEVNGMVYLSGMGTAANSTGRSADHDRLRIKQSLLSIGELLAMAGLDFRHIVFANPYLGPSQRNWDNLNTVWRQFFEFGNTPARATLTMARVPGDDIVEISAVAVTDLNRRQIIRPISREPSPTASPAVMAGEVLYTSGFSGFMPGQGYITEDFEDQMRFAMRNIQDCLEVAGMSFENVVNVNAYLGSMDDYQKMNRIYREYFPDGAVARTTIQQSPTDPDNRPKIQFTAIAHRSVTQRPPIRLKHGSQ